jgi:hypothetical protein
LADDPLLYTGGGRTQLQLDLLFDVALAGSSITTDDVRQLTAPLWNLAENTAGREGQAQPPQVRFLWGKSWDIPGVITAVAERLDHFTPAGVPQRSWLRLHFWRVQERVAARPVASPSPETAAAPAELPPQLLSAPGDDWASHETTGGATGAGERLDQIAFRYYGDPSLWRVLAAANQVEDPTSVPAGRLLRIPPLSLVRQSS